MAYEIAILRTWPETLPLPKVSFNETVVFSFLISDKQYPYRARRDPYGTRFREVNLRLTLTTEQRQAFETFFHDDCSSGTAPFSVPLKVENEEGTLKEWVAKFNGGYSVEKQENLWEVSCSLFLIHEKSLDDVASPLYYDWFHVLTTEGGSDYDYFYADGELFFVKIPEES